MIFYSLGILHVAIYKTFVINNIVVWILNRSDHVSTASKLPLIERYQFWKVLYMQYILFSFQHQAVQEMFNCWVWRIPPLRYLGGSQLEQMESSWDTESTFYIEISLQFKLFEIINRQWWKLLQDWVSTLPNWHSKRNFMIWINREFNYVVLIDIIHLSLW